MGFAGRVSALTGPEGSLVSNQQGQQAGLGVKAMACECHSTAMPGFQKPVQGEQLMKRGREPILIVCHVPGPYWVQVSPSSWGHRTLQLSKLWLKEAQSLTLGHTAEPGLEAQSFQF